ncbi:MAG: hypothetical protein ABI970_22310 [Chloroflexota bacterium]
MLSESPPYQQLEMVWSYPLFNAPPPRTVPDGYMLRTYHPDDEQQFYELSITSDQWRQSDT